MSTPEQAATGAMENSATGMISCTACNKEIHSSAASCPHCGAQRRTSRYKSKTVAALFAFFLGGFGGHRFYLGQWWGIFYLLFFWLWIPGIVAFIEFIYFLMRDSKKWDDKYNEGIPAGTNDGSSGAVIAILVVFGGFTFLAMIGVLAAIALPAYQGYTIKTSLNGSHDAANEVMQAVESYAVANKEWPLDMKEAGVDQSINPDLIDSLIVEDGVIYITPSQSIGVEGDIVYVPSVSQSGIEWSCKESTVDDRYLPPKCK